MLRIGENNIFHFWNRWY